MQDSALLALEKVELFFQLDSGRQLKVLEDISFELRQHEILVLLGPSGSGKSTCLRILAGLIAPSSGQVLCHGMPLQGPNQLMAMVFQNFALLPWLNIAENIGLGLLPLAIDRAQRLQKVRHAIDLVGLEGFEEAYPKELSGGMRQRVGLARALVMDRPILCLDEPFSALDVLTAESLRKEFLSLWLNKTTKTESMLLVTHNIVEAVQLGGRILVMGGHPGSIRHSISNTLSYPRDERDPAFKDLVDLIHDSFTRAIIPDVPIVAGAAEEERAVEALPPAPITDLIGFVETLARAGSRQDIFVLAKHLGRDSLNVLMLAKAAELLDLVDTPHNWVVLTEKGLNFVAADINQRKRMIHDQLLTLQLTQLFCAFLRGGANGVRTTQEAIANLHACLPNEDPKQQFETLVQWGRFGELLGFNRNKAKVYCHEPIRALAIGGSS